MSEVGAPVAIVTVTTNAAKHLPEYIEAVNAIEYPKLKLWICDNGSTDGSAELAEEGLPWATVLRNGENLGFTGACNRVIRQVIAESRTRYILFLNDDTAIEPDALEAMVRLADHRTLVAPITYLADRPGLLDDAAGSFDWWRGTWKERRHAQPPRPSDGYVHAIDNANLSCLLVPIEAFDDAGLLDDDFFVYYDDTDFCRRVRDEGYRIFFEPAAVVHHRKGATLGGQLSDFGCYYLSRNRPHVIRKHEPAWKFGVFMSYYLSTRAARMAAWAARGRMDLVRATAAGLRDFARGRMGKRR